jgi:16S rRNA (uracil1498-N3)-methyltransferase
VANPSEAKLERFRKIVVEACKQSSRNYLMEIAELTDWNSAVASLRGERCLLDPSGSVSVAELNPAPDTVAIGPEGGWTEEELSVARESGWTIGRLPGNILRVETAAIAVAAWRRFRSGQ